LFDLAPAHRDKQLAQIETELGIQDRPAQHQLKILDETGLQAAADTGGIIFANHSWSHPNLIVLDDNDLQAEIIRAEEWLLASGLPVINWFAYPRGNKNQRVRAAVRQHCQLAFAFGDGQPRLDELDSLPRIGLYRKDQNRLRFELKLMGAGRLKKWRA
jgi:peptidoglycan/xylan/chitin deacetylase (PgdA/CDA1 family)